MASSCNQYSDKATVMEGHLAVLPPEMIRMILTKLQLADLRASVKASAVFCRWYQFDKRYILQACLHNTLGISFYDAYVGMQSSGPDFVGRCKMSKDAVFNYMAQYSQTRQDWQFGGSVEELEAMARFHLTTIEPLAKLYSSTSLRAFTETVKGSRRDQQLSKSEKQRIYRALYRFQLLCNLTGSRKCNQTRQEGFQWMDDIESFFKNYEAHEIEEILCIHQYAKNSLSRLLWTIREDPAAWGAELDEEHDEFVFPDGMYNLEDEYIRETMLKILISDGFPFLLRSVARGHCVADRAVLLAKLRLECTHFIDDEIMYVTSDRHDAWRLDRLTAGGQKAEDQFEIAFEKDTERSPNLAWCRIWQGSYVGLHDGYRLEELREGGYVFWDAQRLGDMDFEDL